MKKAVLVLLLAVVGVSCFAADYINIVKRTYLENDNYTVEQIINAVSYGKQEWTQSGRYVTVSCNLLEHIQHKLGPVKFTFSVSSDGIEELNFCASKISISTGMLQELKNAKIFLDYGKRKIKIVHTPAQDNGDDKTQTDTTTGGSN